MESDIEIAQKTQMMPVTEIAAKIKIPQEGLDLYGQYKAKLRLHSSVRCRKSPLIPLSVASSSLSRQ